MKLKLDFIHIASGKIDQSLVIEIPENLPYVITPFNSSYDLIVSKDDKNCRCSLRDLMVNGCKCGGT